MSSTRNSIQRFVSVLRRGTPIGLLILCIALPIQYAGAQGKGGGRSNRKGNSSQRQRQDTGLQGGSGNRQMNTSANSFFSPILSQSQLQQLIGMREEEKLAHDVYVALGQSSGLQIFTNISRSESKHMSAVEQLISRYATIIPLANLGPGRFSNAQIQQLYTDLVAAGSSSPVAALAVGAKIEEMDIRDLQVLMGQNLPQQVTRVLANLQRASGNHLRAFMGELQKVGATYTPELLEQQVFDSILASGNVRGSVQSAPQVPPPCCEMHPSRDRMRAPQSPR